MPIPIPPLHLLIAGLFLGLVALAALRDVISFRIPNAITLSIALLYPAYVLAAPDPVNWVGASAIGAAVFVVGTLCFGIGVLGGGDVKLMAGCALWAGTPLALEFLLLTALAGGAMALVLVSPMRYALAAVSDRIGAAVLRDMALEQKLPYGVAIAAGVAVVLAPALLTP